MKKYSAESIRNICLLAHGGVGKTSLAEALSYTAGATTKLGRVDNGSSIFDTRLDEKERKQTISMSAGYCEWSGTKINFLDFLGGAKGGKISLHSRRWGRRRSGRHRDSSSIRSGGFQRICLLSTAWTRSRPTTTEHSRRCANALAQASHPWLCPSGPERTRASPSISNHRRGADQTRGGVRICGQNRRGSDRPDFSSIGGQMRSRTSC